VSDRDLFGDRRPDDDRLDDDRLAHDGLAHDRLAHDPLDADLFEDGLDPDELADQRAVRALLASLPDPGPVPPDVLDRITSTLRSLQEQLEAGPHPLAAPHQHAALAPVPVGATAVGRPRRLPLRGVWLAAAAAVVLAGGGAVVSRLADDSSPRESAASAARDSAGSAASESGAPAAGAATTPPDDLQAPVYTSGTRYRSVDLVRQAQALVTARRVAGGPADSGAAALPRRRTVADCLRAVAPEGSTLLAGDLATYEGRPAIVLVLATAAGREVRVTGRTCAPGSTAVRTAPLP
jgi:hypothetical protein